MNSNKSTLYGAIFNLVNTIIGAGILLLPRSLGVVGVGLGTILLVCFGLLSALSCYVLKEIYKFTKAKTYAGMGSAVFGKGFGVFIDLFLVVFTIGVVIGYLVIVGDQFYFGISYFVMNLELDESIQWIRGRTFILCLAALIFIVPLTLLKNFDSLRFTSIVAFLFILYITVVMVLKTPWSNSCELVLTANYICDASSACSLNNDPYIASTTLEQCVTQCQQSSLDKDPNLKLTMFSFTMRSFFALPFFAFAHTSQVPYIPILTGLERPTTKRVMTVVGTAYLIVFVLYLLNALSGYWSFCGYASSNILDSYQLSDPYILLSRLAIGLIVCFSIPLFTQPLRVRFFEVLKRKASMGESIVMTVIMVAILTALAIFFGNLDVIMGIIGAVGCSSFMLILPGLMYFKVLTIKKCRYKPLKYIVSVLMIVLGLFFLVMGTYTTLNE